ncbi:MAG: hypothetical protein JNM38_07920 [Acidobacteria bacterium]|nr:hypothetical protein [Acidobacteriota bacterium]
MHTDPARPPELALLATQRVAHDDALGGVADLVEREIVYLPHPTEA